MQSRRKKTCDPKITTFRLAKSGIIFFAIVLSSFFILNYHVYAQTTGEGNYYVDSINGSDKNNGNSQNTPWKTLTPINNHNFDPGDTIFLKRNSIWTSSLEIKNSGEIGNPITVTSYGEGAKPIIDNPNLPAFTGIIRINASWIVLEGVLLKNAHTGYGVFVSKNATHNIIRDIEVANVCKGASIKGQFNLITLSNFHDLTMCVNTQGGNDDFGAVGIDLQGPDNEVSYNRMVNCKAPSYDYGTDGGAIELFGVVDRSYIHHNWSDNNEGFLEAGSINNTGSANDVKLSYNLIYNSHKLFGIHITGKFGIPIHNFIVDNNTFIDITNYNLMQWSTFYFDGSVAPDEAILRNNIFYIGNFKWIADANYRGWDFTHLNNLYFMTNPHTGLGFTLGLGEKVANPLFVNLSNLDFRLQPNSPGIDAALNLGYNRDFENKIVSVGNHPDIGAFEDQGIQTSSPKVNFQKYFYIPTISKQSN